MISMHCQSFVAAPTYTSSFLDFLFGIYHILCPWDNKKKSIVPVNAGQ